MNIRTLHGDDEGDGPDDGGAARGSGDDRRNTEFYTGGHDSGLAVENPLSALFGGAAARGASVGAAAGGATTRITLYSNGFTVNDGPLRPLEEEANRQFLADVEAGFAPRELREAAARAAAGGAGPSSEIHIALEDKRKMRAPEVAGGGGATAAAAAPAAFEGAGARLGPAAAAAPAPAPASEREARLTAARAELAASAGASAGPQTTLQLRLPDGSAVRQAFPATAPLSAVQCFAAAAAGAPVRLAGGFPPRPIENLAQQITEAGLANASITVKFA